MKKSIIILVTAAFIAVGCGQSTKEQEQAMATLKEFYTLLITEMNSEQPDMETIEGIINGYVTAEFQDELRRYERNYKYFTIEDRLDNDAFETLKITPHDKWKNAYKVFWYNDKEGLEFHLTLLVVKNSEGRYMINGLEERMTCAYQRDDDDWYDDDWYDGDASEYSPDYYVPLDSELLALTARSDMSAEYDRLRHAIAFASEIMKFPLEPIPPHGYALMGYDDDEEPDVRWMKWGTGMKPLRQLLTYADSHRADDMEGLEMLIRRYGMLIKLLIPYEKYVANNWERMTIQLLTAYNDLSAQEGSFGKVFDAMDYEASFDDYYKELSPFARDKRKKAFLNEEGEFDYYSKENFVWAYSFWGRRYNENPDNIPHLAAALKTIRNELYAPNAKPPKADKNTPPIEPYLTSDIRPNEKLYPWKLYTDRMRFVEYGDYDYGFIIVEHNGTQRGLLNHLDDDIILNRGDVIDVAWSMEIVYTYDGNEITFSEWAHKIRMVEPSATTRFAQKYGGVPTIEYIGEDAIDEKIKLKMLDKLFDYLPESQQPEIAEAVKMCRTHPQRVKIYISDCIDWYDDLQRKTVYGHLIEIYLSHGKFAVNDENYELFDPVKSLIYNPDTDTLHIEVEVTRG